MEISLQGITKNFKLKTALNNVSVDFVGGKIHGLLGENGAGKSTLARIISGDIKQSSGEIFIDGRKVDFTKPADALKKGIAIVNQRPMISDFLTVDENIMLFGRKKNKFIFPLWAPKDLRQLKKKWAPWLKFRTLVRDLGGNNRFYVSLLTALMHQPKFLILDEPSAFLDAGEREDLYKNLHELVDQGMGILVITHSTAEANNFCDTITFLCEGKLKSSYINDGTKTVDALFSTGSFENSILNDERCGDQDNDGKKNASDKLDEFSANKNPCLVLEKVSSRPKDKPALLEANIVANYGEITAVSGIKEAAIGTLEDFVTGINSSYAKGILTFYESDKSFSKIKMPRRKFSTKFLRKHKTAIVPSDKTFRASNPELTLEEMLGIYCPIEKQKENALDLIKKAGVNILPNEKCENLSGGMLQRLVLERELSTDPNLIILCNPMHGLDIASQSKLARRTMDLAKSGKAVLIVGSADFPMTLCSKVYTMESGRTKLVYEQKDSGKEDGNEKN